jgi:hypothetical protein
MEKGGQVKAAAFILLYQCEKRAERICRSVRLQMTEMESKVVALLFQRRLIEDDEVL